MKPVRGFAAGCAVWLLALGTAPAAWDNVFQTTCFHCKKTPAAAYYAPVAAAGSDCCPTVSYVQRCFYQPCTTYKTTTYYEPVTSYQKSYYYEPVTTYRYSTYYDPCTGCPQQVACPQTCYRLRSQCNAVTNYVARCAQVPVTTYRQISYYEPVISNPCPPNPCADGAAPAGGYLPPASVGGAPPQSQMPPAGVDGGNLPPQNVPPASGFRGLSPTRPLTNPLPPGVRPERVAYGPNGTVSLRGQVVRNDYVTPSPSVQLVFVNPQDRQARYAVTADPTGQFSADLPPGGWDVYLGNGNGQPTYYNRIELQTPRRVTLVSR